MNIPTIREQIIASYRNQADAVSHSPALSVPGPGRNLPNSPGSIPTIREQIIASYSPPFQAEAAVIYGLLLAFTCWLYYAVAVT